MSETIQIAHAVATDRARAKVREAAMHMASMGLSADTVRAALLDMAKTEGERAAKYIEKYDADEAAAIAADRADFAEEHHHEAVRHRETGT